jgi:endonuclease/exonuclease/phosphatase family metal-dependent hydrolase
MLNTHLDRRGREARRRGAALIVETIARLPRLPCIVTGDLNAGDRAAPFNILRAASLRDTYRDVFRGRAPATVHHYDMRRAGLRTRIRGRAPKIDFVLCDRSWRVASADIVRETPFGCWPSDHYPVAAELELVVARSVTQTSEAKGAMGPTTAPPRAKG